MSKRLTGQLLAGPPARDPDAVARRLLAVQAQDARGVRLAIRARTRGLTAADLDNALTAKRSLLISWLNRGTLHLVFNEDYPWLHALTTPPLFSANGRRLAQEGVPPRAAERGVAVIERSLERDGPLTRAQLRERVAAAGVRTEGQALVHLLMLACLRGLAIRGLWADEPVLELDPPRRLVHRWRSLYDAELGDEAPSRVTWDIEPGSEGTCLLTVTHDQLEGAPKTAASVSGPGWMLVLSGLKTLLETGHPLSA
jgi:hypothetical protein